MTELNDGKIEKNIMVNAINENALNIFFKQTKRNNLTKQKCRGKIKPSLKHSISKKKTIKKKLNKFKRKFLLQFTDDEKIIKQDSKISKKILLPWERREKSKIKFKKNE